MDTKSAAGLRFRSFCRRLLYVVSANILKTLAPYGDIAFAAGEHDDGRSGHAVVVRGHGIVICARGTYRHDIASAYAVREKDVFLNDIAAFAAAAHQ